jgi:hypothetical protein
MFTELLLRHFHVKRRIKIFAREWDDNIKTDIVNILLLR